jgi:dTDP-glucose pyrophosphorylase
LSKLKKIDHQNTWDDPEMNILIPMAGAGSRFEKAGYTFPKPIIEIHGKPMIQWVIESINVKGNFIFLIQKNHQKKFNLRSLLKSSQKLFK